MQRTGQGQGQSLRPLARYVAVWVAIGAAVAIAVFAARGWRTGDAAVLPPVREPELTGAVRAADCRLSVVRGHRETGAFAAPARPGVYDDSPAPVALAAAMRRGTIVVTYRPGLDGDDVDRLEAVQGNVPEGTILAPGPRSMRPEVEVNAARRRLSCPEVRDATLDALRLFQGRYLGSAVGS